MTTVDTGALQALKADLPTALTRSVNKVTAGVFEFKKPELAQLPPDEAAVVAENLKASKATADEAITASVLLIRQAEEMGNDVAAANLKKGVVDQINGANGYHRDLGAHCALFYIEQLVRTCWDDGEGGYDPHWVRQIVEAAVAVRLIQHAQHGEFTILKGRFDLTEDFSPVRRAASLVETIEEMGKKTANASRKQFEERLAEARTIITKPITFEELCAGNPGQIEIEIPRGGSHPSGHLFLSSDGQKALLVAAVGGIYHHAKHMVGKTHLLVASIGHRVPDSLPEEVKDLSFWVYVANKAAAEKIRGEKVEVKKAAEIENSRTEMSAKGTVSAGEFFAKPGAKPGFVFINVRRPLTWTKDKKKREQNRAAIFTDVFCLIEVRKDEGEIKIRLVEFPERLRKGLFEEVPQGWLTLGSSDKRWKGFGPLTALLYASESEVKKGTAVAPAPVVAQIETPAIEPEQPAEPPTPESAEPVSNELIPAPVVVPDQPEPAAEPVNETPAFEPEKPAEASAPTEPKKQAVEPEKPAPAELVNNEPPAAAPDQPETPAALPVIELTDAEITDAIRPVSLEVYRTMESWVASGRPLNDKITTSLSVCRRNIAAAMELKWEAMSPEERILHEAGLL